MYYEIQSVEELDNGHTRTVAAFWADQAAYHRNPNAPLLTEDFISNVQPTGTRLVTNEDGWVMLTDGSYVDPDALDPEREYRFEEEEYEIDVAAVLIENIERFLYRQREDGDTNAERILRGELRGDRTSARLAQRELPKGQRAEFLNDPAVRATVTGDDARRKGGGAE